MHRYVTQQSTHKILLDLSIPPWTSFTEFTFRIDLSNTMTLANSAEIATLLSIYLLKLVNPHVQQPYPILLLSLFPSSVCQ